MATVTDLGRLLAAGQDYYVVESLAFEPAGRPVRPGPEPGGARDRQTFVVTTDTKTGAKKVWGPLECRGERMNGCYRMTAGPDGSLYSGSRMDGPVGGAGGRRSRSEGAFWLLRLKPAS